MTRRRLPRSVEIQAARHDGRLLKALRANPDDPYWRVDARCRTVDPEAFFPLPTEPTDGPMRVCRPCPVQSECLATALSIGEHEGVWGATTPRERDAMLPVWRERQGASR